VIDKANLPDDFEEWTPENQHAWLNGEEVLALQRQTEIDAQAAGARMRETALNVEGILGAKIRQLRERAGWSQADLAERLKAVGFEFHQTTVAKMEAGKRPIRVAEVFALGVVFRMPMTALMHLPLKADLPSLSELDRQLKEIEDSQQENREMYLGLISAFADNQVSFESRRQELLRAMTQGVDELGKHQEEA
jgi:transcriptional regulator with XRE-family HTH domain